jgi:hypothetical protein
MKEVNLRLEEKPEAIINYAGYIKVVKGAPMVMAQLIRMLGWLQPALKSIEFICERIRFGSIILMN